VDFGASTWFAQTLRHHAGSRRDYALKTRTEIAMPKLIEEHRAEPNDLCRRDHVSRLELFGSSMSGEFDAEASDLDLLVEFQSFEPGDRADGYFGLLHGLEDLFSRKIDLVTIQAIRNHWFRRGVDRLRKNSIASCIRLAVAESAKSAPSTAFALPPRSGGGGAFWCRFLGNST
jgi:predicted nucleotidyltransferase